MSRQLICILFLSGLAATARGQTDSSRNPNTVQPERPTVATHAGTVAPRYMELEEGLEWDRLPGNERSLLVPTNLKIGLAPRAQLNLLLNIIRQPRAIGSSVDFGDLTVGVKYRLGEAMGLLGDFALLPAIKFPTATGGAGTRSTDFSLLLISSHQLGSVAMDLNAGATRRVGVNPTAPEFATIWTASFGFPIAGPVGATAEIFGYPGTSGTGGAKPTAALLLGPTLLVRNWLALDAGFITPLTGPQPHALYAGFVWNLGRL
jgi:Putative MetA-pathway of phenol degradation